MLTMKHMAAVEQDKLAHCRHPSAELTPIGRTQGTVA